MCLLLHNLQKAEVDCRYCRFLHIIGEYGTHGSKSVSKNSSASEIQAAADQAADIVKQAKTYGVATFYWMSIFSEKDRTVPQWTLPTVVEAMKKAYNE